MADKHQKPGFDTLAVRAGQLRSDFQEQSETLFLTSSFVYKSAAEAARKFANEEPGYIYSRFTNPTVSMFQDRLAALEGSTRWHGEAIFDIVQAAIGNICASWSEIARGQLFAGIEWVGEFSGGASAGRGGPRFRQSYG